MKKNSVIRYSCLLSVERNISAILISPLYPIFLILHPLRKNILFSMMSMCEILLHRNEILLLVLFIYKLICDTICDKINCLNVKFIYLFEKCEIAITLFILTIRV